ncbi:MAG: hypothetical protein AAGD34_22085 [Pseudomonadota bacterium]
MMGHTARAIAHTLFSAMGDLVKAAEHRRRRRVTVQRIGRLEPHLLSDIGVEAVHAPRLTQLYVPAHRLSPQRPEAADTTPGATVRRDRGGPAGPAFGGRTALAYSPFQTGRSGSK